MNTIFTLAGKDLRLLFRDPTGAFFVVGFPLLMAVMFGYIFAGAGGGGTRSKMPIALVDLDRSEASREFVKGLAGSEQIVVTPMESEEAARDAVRRRTQTAMVVLRPGFGLAQDRPFWGDPAEIEIGVDPSRAAESGLLQGLIIERAYRGFQRMMANPRSLLDKFRTSGGDEGGAAPPVFLPAMLTAFEAFIATIPQDGAATTAATSQGSTPGLAGWEPVRIKTTEIAARRSGPPNSFAVSFPQGLIWGILGCTAGFGISLVTERTGGTLTRLRLAPISRAHILGGKALACFVTTVSLSAVLLLLAALVFNVRPTSLPLLIVSIVCVAAGFVGVMMLLAVCGKTEAAAGGIGWAVLTVMAMLGGGMVPTFLMPGWMQQIAVISPVMWAMRALEGSLWRGFGPADMLLPWGILLGIGAAGFTLGARLMVRQDGRA